MERHSTLFPTRRPAEPLTRPTRAQLAALDLGQRHPALPTSYYYKHFGTHEYTRKVLRQLFKAHAMGLPLGHDQYGLSREAWLFARQRNVFYPVQVWPLGEALLKLNGLWLGRAQGKMYEYEHTQLCSLISYSFESAPRPFDITLRTQADILNDERCPPATRTRENPHHIDFNPARRKSERRDAVIPDHELFGYARLQPNGKTRFVYFHGFEADRNTEQYSTIKHKLQQYVRYYLQRRYTTDYGLVSAPTVPIITINEARADGILKLIQQEVPDQYQKYFAVKVISDPRKEYPPATAHMLTEPWRTAVGELDILTLLGVDHELRQSGKNLRADEEDKGGRGGNNKVDGGNPTPRQAA